MYFLVDKMQRFEVIRDFLKNFHAFGHDQGVVSDRSAKVLNYMRAKFAQVIRLLYRLVKARLVTLNFLHIRPFILEPVMFVQYC